MKEMTMPKNPKTYYIERLPDEDLSMIIATFGFLIMGLFLLITAILSILKAIRK